MKPGQEIVVTAYGGKKEKLVVAQVIDNIVLVCSKDEYEQAARESRSPATVGFRLESVKAV